MDQLDPICEQIEQLLDNQELLEHSIEQNLCIPYLDHDLWEILPDVLFEFPYDPAKLQLSIYLSLEQNHMIWSDDDGYRTSDLLRMWDHHCSDVYTIAVPKKEDTETHGEK